MAEMERSRVGGEAQTGELGSWKEIAHALGVSVKTAQRYESERGLPVRRVGTRVLISVGELEEWKRRGGLAGAWHSNVRLLRGGLIVSGVLLFGLVLAVGVYWWNQRPGAVVNLVVAGTQLSATDASGRPVWIHTFGQDLTQGLRPDGLGFRLADLDGDGRAEAVGVWYHQRRDIEGWKVTCLSEAGQIRWELAMDDHVRTAEGKDFGPPYVVREVEVFDSPENDGTKWTAAVFVHVADVVSTLVVVDREGKRRGQYWHVGHLNALELFDADGDGKADIVAGGVRHGVEQAVLVAFDPARVGGANAMPAGHPRAILDKGPSTEKRTAYFARSELSRRTALFNFVAMLLSANGKLQAHVVEQIQTPAGYLMYSFAPGLRLEGVGMSVSFSTAYTGEALKEFYDDQFPEREVMRLQKEFRMERGR